MIVRRPIRKLITGAVLVAAVVGLSACNPAEAGSAAVVGPNRVTETVIMQDAKEVLAQIQAQNAIAPSTDLLLRELVQRQVDIRLYNAAAVREGITVTQGQVEALITQAGGRANVEKSFATADQQWVPASGVDDAARVFLIQQGLVEKLAPGKSTTEQAAALQKYLADLSKQVGVSVSPRYGSWDAAKASVVAPVNDLSSPAASASASPSGS
ncbi:MAG TPA: hypothetical protein VIM19_20400 [Actinomycetes bacterium]